MRCIEAAMKAKGLSPQLPPMTHGSADIEEHCRRVLTNINNGPQHVFGDHLERLTPASKFLKKVRCHYSYHYHCFS